MKKLILLSLLCCAAIASDAPPRVAATGRWKHEIYELWLPGIERGSWDPEKTEPPLSVSKAVGLARKALEEMMGEEAPTMFCSEISLLPGSGRYLVTFLTTPTTEVIEGKSRFKPAMMPFSVSADGTVMMPKKKPIQPPVPTRGK